MASQVALAGFRENEINGHFSLKSVIYQTIKAISNLRSLPSIVQVEFLSSIHIHLSRTKDMEIRETMPGIPIGIRIRHFNRHKGNQSVLIGLI